VRTEEQGRGEFLTQHSALNTHYWLTQNASTCSPTPVEVDRRQELAQGNRSIFSRLLQLPPQEREQQGIPYLYGHWHKACVLS